MILKYPYTVKAPSVGDGELVVQYKSSIGWLTVKTFPLSITNVGAIANDCCRILNLKYNDDELYLKNVWNYTHDLPVLDY